MYYRGGIPAHLVEDGPGSDKDQTDGSLDSEAEEDDDAVAYAEAMQWAEEKEEEVGAHEQKLQSDLQAGNARPVGPLKGRWDLCSSGYYSGEMAFDVLFLGKPSESDLEEYGESQDSSKLDG
jgi:hypothetical protein